MRSRLTILLTAFTVFVAGQPRPSGPTRAFRFAILGDRTGGAAPNVFAEAWRELAAFSPEFVINTGDLIEGHNTESEAAAEWSGVKRIANAYKLPLFCVPGNHDIWDQSSEKLYVRESGHAPQYSFDWRGAHFTVLDNSRGPMLSEEALRFLDRDLAAHPAAAPKFIFFHEPFWLLYLKLGSGDFALHQLARKYHVSYVISGHGHQLVSMKRDGIVYVEVGSSGASISRGTSHGQGFAEGWFYQFGIADVKLGKAAIAIHELAPPFGRGRVIAVPTAAF